MSNSKVTKKLEDVVDFVKGKPLSSKNAKKGPYGVVAGGTKISVYHNEYNAENCISVSASGTAGHIMYHKNKKVFLTDCFSVSPKNEKELNKDFLYYFLVKNQERMYSLASGGGVPHFYPKDMADFEIEIPVDIEEQKRIAGILSNVDSTIKLAEDEYDQLNRLLTGFMNDSFSSLLLNKIESVKLDGLGEVSRGKSKHRPRNDPSLFGGKYPFIQTGNISNSILFVEKYENTYNEKGLKQSKLWKKGTLCITIAANIAETAILNFDACFPDSIIGFVPFDSTNIFYVKMHLDYIKTKLLQAAVGGGQMNLNTEKLLSFDFFNPPKEEQDRLGNLYLLFHKLISNKTMEINKLIELKKGLLQQLIK